MFCCVTYTYTLEETVISFLYGDLRSECPLVGIVTTHILATTTVPRLGRGRFRLALAMLFVRVGISVRPSYATALGTSVPTRAATTHHTSVMSSCTTGTGLPNFHPNGAPGSVVRGHFGGRVRRRLLSALFRATYSATLRRGPGLGILGFKGPRRSLSSRNGCATADAVAMIPRFRLPRCGNVRIGIPSSRMARTSMRRTLGSLTRRVTRFAPISHTTRGSSITVVSFGAALSNGPMTRTMNGPMNFLRNHSNR